MKITVQQNEDGADITLSLTLKESHTLIRQLEEATVDHSDRYSTLDSYRTYARGKIEELEEELNEYKTC